MNVAIYTRVSTDEQVENYSIDAQTQRLTAYCAAKDWNIYKIYTDGGYSGSNINRPALQSMISDIKEINIVLVYKLDRLSRSQKDTLYLIEDIFLSNNIEFVSVNESLDTSSPYGRAMIGILSAFAQLEREQIKERMTMGRTERAKDGFFHGGAYIPIGYDYVDGDLIINDYEALQINEIFYLALKGYSIHHIQRHMHENFTNKYSSWNSHISIRNCLSNVIYTGKVKFNNKVFEGKHEKIISEELFYSVQKIIFGSDRENKKTSSQKSPFKAASLLTSMLICSNCGARYYSDHGKYKCYSRGKSTKKYIKDPDCKNENWDIDKLDSLIISEIKKLQFNDDYRKETFNKHKKYNSIEDTNRIYLKKVDELDKQIERVFDLYQVGDISITQIKDRLDKLQSEKSNLKSKIVQINDTRKTYDEISKILSEINNIFESGTLSEQRLVVSALIDFIEIGNDINIHWNFK